MSKKQGNTDCGIQVDPLTIYNASGCMKILGVCRATLRNYVDRKGLPLKPIDDGRISGKEILDWLSSLPATRSQRGRKVHRKADNSN